MVTGILLPCALIGEIRKSIMQGVGLSPRVHALQVLECLVLIYCAENAVTANKIFTQHDSGAAAATVLQLQRIVRNAGSDLRQSILTAQLAAVSGRPSSTASCLTTAAQDLTAEDIRFRQYSATNAEAASLADVVAAAAAAQGQDCHRSAPSGASRCCGTTAGNALRLASASQGRGVDMLSEVLQLQPLLADDLLSMSEAAATAAQIAAGEKAQKWACEVDAALSETVRAATVHHGDGRWERYAAIQSMASTHRLLSASGCTGQSNGRNRRRRPKERSYLEGALSLAAVDADLLILQCEQLLSPQRPFGGNALSESEILL